MMPGFTAKWGTLTVTSRCGLHQQQIGPGNMRCQLRDGCRPYWYMEGSYREFNMPETEEKSDE